jgi:hypothetical protein
MAQLFCTYGFMGVVCETAMSIFVSKILIK